ncbi:MAG TPA: hypothetical protein VML55_15350 [Planctomycetaceae bacterium]|nr:hypothetical protein [Planctomycetaceae bacterium]
MLRFSREPMEDDQQSDSLQIRTEPQWLLALEEFLARPRLEQTAGGLLTILDQCLDAGAEFDREENRPYMGEVLAESPEASREVKTLRCADDAGHARLEDLREHVAREFSQACVSEEIRQELHDWTQSQTAHRRHENRLVNESLNRDTGGES